jgi:hypothetical protein
MIVLLLESEDTPSGTKASIHKAILGGILSVDEAEAVHGEVVDEQTNAVMALLQGQIDAESGGDDES